MYWPNKQEVREAGKAIRAHVVEPVGESMTGESIAAAAAFVIGMFAFLLLAAWLIPLFCL